MNDIRGRPWRGRAARRLEPMRFCGSEGSRQCSGACWRDVVHLIVQKLAWVDDIREAIEFSNRCRRCDFVAEGSGRMRTVGWTAVCGKEGMRRRAGDAFRLLLSHVAWVGWI